MTKDRALKMKQQTKQKIITVVIVGLTIFSTWNFAKVFFGANIWADTDTLTIQQAYGTGLLSSLPMMFGFFSLFQIVFALKHKDVTGEKKQ